MARARGSRGAATGTGRFVALLRGVNVGGKNRLPMERLRALAEECGCSEVSTYIQSGNLVFSGDPALAAELPLRLAQALERSAGLRVPVVVRAAAELRAALEESPFLARGCDPATLYLAFLGARPTAQAQARLDPNRSPGDSFVLLGRDLHLHLPGGAGKSRITNAWLDSVLQTVSTVRNFRTVEALAGLADP